MKKKKKKKKNCFPSVRYAIIAENMLYSQLIVEISLQSVLRTDYTSNMAA